MGCFCCWVCFVLFSLGLVICCLFCCLCYELVWFGLLLLLFAGVWINVGVDYG